MTGTICNPNIEHLNVPTLLLVGLLLDKQRHYRDIAASRMHRMSKKNEKFRTITHLSLFTKLNGIGNAALIIPLDNCFGNWIGLKQ